MQAEVSAETFPWPKDFDLAAYCEKGHFDISSGRRVRLSFCIDKACGQHLIESPLATDQVAQDLGDKLHITAMVEETELLHRWLRGWGVSLTQLEITPV